MSRTGIAVIVIVVAIVVALVVLYQAGLLGNASVP